MANINRSASFHSKGKLTANGSKAAPVVAVGSRPLIAQFNSIAGSSVVAAESADDARNKIGYLWGVGYGDRGYGQTSYPITKKYHGSSIRSPDWINLLAAATAIRNWQNSPVSFLSSSTFEPGELILAAHPSSFTAPVDVLDGNRFHAQLVNMTLTSNAATSVRSTAWGSSSISAVIEIAFASENAARHFFNSGGQLRLTFEHPNTALGTNTGWNLILSNIAVAISAHSSTMLLNGWGSARDVGYFELSPTFQTVMEANNTSLYVRGSQDVLVEARYDPLSYRGMNGAKGSSVQLRVTLTSVDAVLYQETLATDSIAAGTTVSISHLRATSGVIIPSPTCSILKGF